MEEFKNFAVTDPRILQGCMDLSVKTPAQVLQEYQNRHRGVSINYNTIGIDQDGQKLFKTIVSTGSTTAEGIASTKKVAKQFGAQALLAKLPDHVGKKYLESAWQFRQTDSHTYGPKRDRVVEYSSAPPQSAYPEHYSASGAEWGRGAAYEYGPPPPYPSNGAPQAYGIQAPMYDYSRPAAPAPFYPPKPRQASLVFCVLEWGELKLTTSPGAELLETIPLTRHRVRVIHSVDAHICPNQLTVSIVPVVWDEDSADFVPMASSREVTYQFAAPSVHKMRSWSLAVHNWKRHAFDVSWRVKV
ncbi:hypothetical protein P43SY_000182 [Pythium insidiosum]|uniref:DRBM domain-containing protein n=1 Tax=Pythium insidiosum TaxID=114742 RepID=A0AAD5Q4U4_PYTIN|nr:hypothetical protein P43SY_000182 [Pythium insidiosum]